MLHNQLITEFPCDGENDDHMKRKSARWFLHAGCMGLVAALIIAIVRPTNPAITLILWPTSIVGLADPTGLLDKLVSGLVMFGGNFLLYGVFGAVAGAATDRHRQ
jgi:hypothetical protein